MTKIPTPQKYFGVIALLVAVFLWGPAPVITKLALVEIPQFSLGFLRSLLATAILLSLFYPRGYFKIEKRDLVKFIAVGLTGSVFNVGFFFYGLQKTTASAAQAIFTIVPVINAVLAYFILREKIKPIQAGGVLIGLAGAVMVATGGMEGGRFNSGALLGDFFIVLAAVSWVFYILISKNLSKRYSPFTITSWLFLVSLFAFMPLMIVENIVNGTVWLGQVSFVGLFGIFYQGVFASVLAFLAYQAGLAATSAFLAGVVLYLNPIFTTIVAAKVLDEKIGAQFLIGTFLIIAGSAASARLRGNS